MEQGTRPYEFDNQVHISVTFEVDLDLTVIDRSVYNVLDWIGDIGGLGEGCFFISTTFLSVIHFGALDNMIISELFRVPAQSKKQENGLKRRATISPVPQLSER